MLPKELFKVTYIFENSEITSSWNKLIVCVQILVGFGFNSNEHLAGQLVHEERIQSTATDKISTITYQNLTYVSSYLCKTELENGISHLISAMA